MWRDQRPSVYTSIHIDRAAEPTMLGPPNTIATASSYGQPAQVWHHPQRTGLGLQMPCCSTGGSSVPVLLPSASNCHAQVILVLHPPYAAWVTSQNAPCCSATSLSVGTSARAAGTQKPHPTVVSTPPSCVTCIFAPRSDDPF